MLVLAGGGICGGEPEIFRASPEVGVISSLPFLESPSIESPCIELRFLSGNISRSPVRIRMTSNECVFCKFIALFPRIKGFWQRSCYRGVLTDITSKQIDYRPIENDTEELGRKWTNRPDNPWSRKRKRDDLKVPLFPNSQLGKALRMHVKDRLPNMTNRDRDERGSGGSIRIHADTILGDCRR